MLKDTEGCINAIQELVEQRIEERMDEIKEAYHE